MAYNRRDFAPEIFRDYLAREGLDGIKGMRFHKPINPISRAKEDIREYEILGINFRRGRVSIRYIDNQRKAIVDMASCSDDWPSILSLRKSF